MHRHQLDIIVAHVDDGFSTNAAKSTTTPPDQHIMELSVCSGFGQLHPRSQGITTLGTIYSSSVFENRAPKGQHLVLNFIGGATNRGIVDQSHEELVSQVTFLPPASCFLYHCVHRVIMFTALLSHQTELGQTPEVCVLLITSVFSTAGLTELCLPSQRVCKQLVLQVLDLGFSMYQHVQLPSA